MRLLDIGGGSSLTSQNRKDSTHWLAKCPIPLSQISYKINIHQQHTSTLEKVELLGRLFFKNKPLKQKNILFTS
jgi:hypothetical protein